MTTAATSDITITARNGKVPDPASRSCYRRCPSDGSCGPNGGPEDSHVQDQRASNAPRFVRNPDCGEKPSCQRPTDADQGAIVLGQSSVHSREDRGAGESRQARARAGLQKGWTVIHGHEDQGGPG